MSRHGKDKHLITTVTIKCHTLNKFAYICIKMNL